MIKIVIDYHLFWFVLIQFKSLEKLLHWAFKWAGGIFFWLGLSNFWIDIWFPFDVFQFNPYEEVEWFRFFALSENSEIVLLAYLPFLLYLIFQYLQKMLYISRVIVILLSSTCVKWWVSKMPFLAVWNISTFVIQINLWFNY